MAIKLQNKRMCEFNTTTMSDLVFLLLIFFMLTSTMIAPNAIQILLPRSESGKTIANKNMEVYIDEQKQYFVRAEGKLSPPLQQEELMENLNRAIDQNRTDARMIVLRTDKSVPIENVVVVMDVVNKINESRTDEDRYKVILATVVP